MIYQNVELHNVAEVRPVASGGVRLQRVPERVRQELNEKAQERVLNPDCAEIRFVCDGPMARIVVSSEEMTEAILFHGDFQSPGRFTISKEGQTIDVTTPERLLMLDASFHKRMAFSPRVSRLVLGGSIARAPVILHEVQGDGIRPPTPEELPRLRYLAYGTSITHGSSATATHLSYVAQAARRLRADVINLGVGGSAYCERAMANYIAGREDWHLCTLALSVNMIGAGFSLDAFYERVSYMVDTVAGADTRRPVACITVYPHCRDFGPEFTSPQDKGTSEEYRQRLRDAVRACPHPNVHLIEGAEILSDITGLTGDLVHPGDHGMIQMGENLAARLKPLVEGML
jgi:lysophospholipase L1-like esterase